MTISKHYLVGIKLADVKKLWPDLQKHLEDEPPMCADPHTPLYAIAPPDESTVRVLYYRSTNTAAGLRIGHAQKSEPLVPDWSFAYRYLERRGKTVVAYRGSAKLAFRSIQRLRAESSLYYIFVQFQQMSSNDRNLEMIDIDANLPHGRMPAFDDWLQPGLFNRVRNYQGYVGLCVESVQMRTGEAWDDQNWENDEPIELGGPTEYHSLWDAPICCNTVPTIKDGKVLDANGEIIGDAALKGAAWDAPATPWGARFRLGGLVGAGYSGAGAMDQLMVGAGAGASEHHHPQHMHHHAHHAHHAHQHMTTTGYEHMYDQSGQHQIMPYM